MAYLDIEKIDEITDNDELLEYLKSWDSKDSSRYSALYDEWEKNMLFFLGHQWIEQKSSADGYDILVEDDEHFRPVTNYCKQNCITKRSQILGKKVNAIVRPNSDNKDDYDASRLGYLSLKAKHAIDQEDELAKILFTQAQVFGGAWRSDYKKLMPNDYMEIPEEDDVKTEFFQCKKCGAIQEDSSVCEQCGDKYMDFVRDVQKVPKVGSDGKQVVRRIQMYEPSVAILDAFRMRSSPAKTQEGLQWLQETTVQPIEWALKCFGNVTPDLENEGYVPHNNLEEILKPEADNLPRPLQLSHDFEIAVSEYHSSTSKNQSQPSTKDEIDPKSILFRKLYHYPTRKYPNGRLILWCGSCVFYSGKPDVPQAEDIIKRLKLWHPYNYFPFDLHPLRFEGSSYLEDQIPINIKINAMDSMIMEHLDRTAAPDRVQFSNVSKNNSDNADGVMEIDPRPELPNGGAPFYLQHPQLSSEIYKMRERWVEEIREAGRVTDIMRGFRPTGVDTYRGLQLLKDAADSSEADLYSRWHDFYRRCQQLKLALIQECLILNNQDLVQMMDTIRLNENMAIDQVKSFTGEDLRNNLNVVIEEIDYVGQSKAAEVDRISGLLESGLIGQQEMQNPMVKYNLIKRFGLGTMSIGIVADIEKAERIVQYAEKGEIPRAVSMIRPYDNLPIFLLVFENFMKMAKFESYPPEFQKVFETQIYLYTKNLLPPPMPPVGPPGPPQRPGVSGGPPPQMVGKPQPRP